MIYGFSPVIMKILSSCINQLPGGYLQIPAAVFEIKEIMCGAGNTLALHELALRHLKSNIILALGIGRPPRQARAFVIWRLGVAGVQPVAGC